MFAIVRGVGAPALILLCVFAASGCLAETEGGESCRCVVESDGMLYDLPCGVQACLGEVGIECNGPGAFHDIDIPCAEDEAAFEEGVCEGHIDGCTEHSGLSASRCPLHCDIDCWDGFCACLQKSPAVRCEDRRGEHRCENTEGCWWNDADCTYSGNGCSAYGEPIDATEAGPAS